MISAPPPSFLRKWRLSSKGPRHSMVCMAVVLLMAAMPSALAARVTLMSGQQDSSMTRGRKLLDAEFSGSRKQFKTRTASNSDYETEGEFKQCLDVPGGDAATAGTQPWVWECDGTATQQFVVTFVTTRDGHKYYQIKSKLPGNMCLAPRAPVSGEAVSLRSCNKNDSAQLWRRKKVGSLSVIIPADNNSLCLDTIDSKINVFSCNGDSESQQFELADA